MIFNTVILGGAGGGSIIEAKAIGETVSFTEGDKVLLTPTTNLFDSKLYSYEYDLIGTSVNVTMSGHEGGACGGILDYEDLTKNHGVVVDRNIYSNDRHIITTITWSDSRDSITGSNMGSDKQADYQQYLLTCYNNPNFRPAVRPTQSYYGSFSGNSIGVIHDGAFQYLYESSNLSYGVSSIDRFVKCLTGSGSTSKDLIRVNEDLSVSSYAADGGRNVMASKYNGAWYIVGHGGIYDLTETQAFTMSGRTYKGVYYFFDDEGDYFLEFNSYLRLKKVTKDSSAWKESELAGCSVSINTCLRDPNTCPSWSAKDFGDHVEMFIVGDLFGYDQSTGAGNKVAHLIFDKATETFTRLTDVFMEIPDTFTRAGHLQVNWDLGLISVEVSYRISDNDGDHFGIFIKKFNNFSKIYKYNAYKNEKGYYYKDTITGFVKENKGVNELGDTVLSVETTEDPNAAPWTNEGVVFGMGVTVNEGDPT